MSYEDEDRYSMTPVDPEAPDRVERLKQLGLGNQPDPEFDEFARKLAETTGAPYAMVNFIDEERQYFAGLHTPGSDDSDPSAAQDAAAGNAEPGRVMERDHGYCPHVVVRKKALVLEDVCDYPRFAGNPVVDEIGIRSYLGAPLIDHTGTTIGTICVVDTEPRPWGRPGLETIKSMAAEMTERLRAREAAQENQTDNR
ncbi:GAF domain-containing protein [Stackebrandtia endophytica]|uniref:GAF domain-containing protein n=1 Tax=Stackebrandtia endophytica TaxID=1496996 RepID=A0A543AXR6_9ACTN|nr:GAF domain-containing protein [Stackebrandtia endophytica]TQL77365.1 GAF domain-containing protein [Stackebrandtia endophytica]